MSNLLHFTGRVAKPPVLTRHGDVPIAKFTLIRNDYAGKDEAGNPKEKTVSIQFTAFRGQAEAIAKHAHKGDQLIVEATLENNNYKDGEGEDQYKINFNIQSFEFGAPGAEKRALLDSKRQDAAAPSGEHDHIPY
jgi:single-strand DNA-binding protein